MTDPRPPGQIAYAAYVTAVERQPVAAAITTAMWARLLPAEQRAWDAAAQAVLARCPHCTAEYQDRYGPPQEDTP
jgi:hypothetical protein